MARGGESGPKTVFAAAGSRFPPPEIATFSVLPYVFQTSVKAVVKCAAFFDEAGRSGTS